MRRRLLYGLALIVLSSLALSIYSGLEDRNHVDDLEQFRVRRGKIDETIEATGEIKAATGAQISLGARVTGTVVKEPISVGDRVRKGDLIAIIDNRELRQDVKRAEAELSRIDIHYQGLIKEKELETRELTKKLENTIADVEKALSELRFRRWNFESIKSLYESKNHSVSERAFREAKNALVQAEKGLQQARNSRQAAKALLARAEAALARLEGEYRQDRRKAEADIEKARIRLSYSEIRAPFSGVITFVSTQEGETVVAGLNAPQFVKILDESRVENWIYVDETDIGKVKEGMAVEFRVDAYPDAVFDGRIDKIYPAPVVQNNVVYYIAVVRIYQKETRLHLKMTTHNTIRIRTIEDTLVVPNGAVKFVDGRYVVKVKGAEGDGFVPVEIGASDSRFTQVKHGLEEGDIVLYRP